jgi:hypothetical protein
MTRHLRTRLLECAGVTLSLLVIFGKPAHAYIDAGTGSYILQAAIAGILAALFLMKSTWSRIIGAVGKRFGKRIEDDK